jgi:hypothetical protein
VHKGSVSHSRVCCALAVGSTLWFGLEDGHLVALDACSHTKVASFPTHADAVVSLAQAGMFLYSLSRNGTVLARSAAAPPSGDKGAAAERAWREVWRGAIDKWEGKLAESVSLESVALRVCTWNVNDSRPRPASVARLVAGERCAACPGAVPQHLSNKSMANTACA